MKARASIRWGRFVWDVDKEYANIVRHGINFRKAAKAFLDPSRLISIDEKHSQKETRWHCVGLTEEGVLTVRFTYRGEQIRIFGAGYWRKGRRLYEATKKKRS